MKWNYYLLAGLALLSSLYTLACNRSLNAKDAETEDPPPAVVENVGGAALLRVAHPEQYPLVEVQSSELQSELNVTGVVTADVSRTIPVVTIAAGRIIQVMARLGDRVTKGQVLMRVESPDVSEAISDYKQAQADDVLLEAQLARSKALYDKGAIAKKDLEIAEDAEEKADVTLAATEERLRVLGADKDHPSSIIDVRAPATGVITDQQVTNASGTQGLAGPNAFAISDITHVWILCDVYENDLSTVRVGDYADIHLNAYPSLVLKGRVGNIGCILDPNIRTAKVRIEVENPGMLLLGMFVRATFHGNGRHARFVVPSSAILHLHDRNWVYLAQGDGSFRRTEVQAGAMLPSGNQEILSGIGKGDRIVRDALLMENTIQP
jgi:membrane fusion protein, heavy metal efflux system